MTSYCRSLLKPDPDLPAELQMKDGIVLGSRQPVTLPTCPNPKSLLDMFAE